MGGGASTQAKQYANLYATEGLRTVKDGIRESTRAARQGLELSKAIYRKIDVTGQKRKKATELAREERRKKLLQGRKGDGSDDEDEGDEALATKEKVQELKVVAAENDPDQETAVAPEDGSQNETRLPKLGKNDESLGFMGINISTSGGTKAKRLQDTPTAKVHETLRKLREQGRRLRMQLVDAIGDKSLLPSTQEVKGYEEEVDDETPAGDLIKSGKALLAAAKLKRKLHRKKSEEAIDAFELKKEVDEALQKYGGTDVLGWNRCPLQGAKWTNVVVYIVRTHGDCSEEVELIFSKVLPQVRAALLPGAISVQLRDLGGMEEDLIDLEHLTKEQRSKLPPLSIGLSSVSEANAFRLVLLGTEYGSSWKATAGDPDPDDYMPASLDAISDEMSELEIIATVACQTSQLKHKAFKKRTTVPTTLLYTCVDPGAQLETFDQGSTSHLSISSPGRREMCGSPVAGQRNRSHAARSKASANGSSTMASSNPFVVMKMHKKEEKRKSRLKLANLNKLVFNALVRDPITGKPRDPLDIFKLLDEDKSGTVDKSEFSIGLVSCGLELEPEDLELIWSSLDEDGGGDLDYVELCTKLEVQYQKVLHAEARNLKQMPRSLSSKLEPLMPPDTIRARLDTMIDFQDTAERQKQRWHTKFVENVVADLKRLLPVLAMAAIDIEEDRERLLESDKGVMPLNFIPEVPEYAEHTDRVLKHSRDFKHGKQDQDVDGFWNTEGCSKTLAGMLDYAKGVVNWPCVLVGDQGSGRSHMVKEFVLAMRRERPMDHIIVHTVGEASNSSDLHDMIWRLCMELGKRFELLEEVRAVDPSTICQYFPRLLLKITIESGVMLLLVIDAIDRIMEHGKPLEDSLHWFPTAVPVQVRLIMTCSQGSTLNALRRKKARFDGHSEVVEFNMPHHGEPRHGHHGANERTTSDSSSDDSGMRYGDGEDEVISSPADDIMQAEYQPAVLHSLSKCKLFQMTGIQESADTDLLSVIERMVAVASEVHGVHAVERYIWMVLSSRQGVLEQDLYELLNANPGNGSTNLPFVRMSYQQFIFMRDRLSLILRETNFGGERMRWVAQASFQRLLNHILAYEDSYVDIHNLVARHYMQQIEFALTSSARWHGESRRAVSEAVFHLSQAVMSEKVLDTVTSLRYIEARCALGINQATGLFLDYKLLLTRSLCALHWIMTDLIKVQDCFTMLRRYLDIFVRYPRWVFTISGSLPDTTGPSIIAKANWSLKNETRPQLAWLNKPQVGSPCTLKIDDRGIVLHAACFSKDMTRLVGGGQDKMLFVWSLPEGSLMTKLPGHADHIMSVQISVDDLYIISGSRDGKVIVWGMPTVQELEERIRNAEEAVRKEAEERAERGEEEEEDDNSQDQKLTSASGAASSKASVDGEEGDDKKERNTEDQHGSDQQRLESKKSVRIKASKPPRDSRVLLDVHLDSTKLLFAIPAHKSTVWSVTFSTVFNHRARLHVLVGQKRHLGETISEYAAFPAMYARLSSSLDGRLAFPLKFSGIILWSRALTEDEKKVRRLRAKANLDAKIAIEKATESADVSSKETDSRPGGSKRAPVKEMKRRKSVSEKLEVEKLLKEVVEQGPIPDFEDQGIMANRIVVYSIVGNMGDDLEEQDILFAIRSFKDSGAIAVVLVGGKVEAPLLQTETQDLCIPVLTVGCDMSTKFQNDSTIIVQRTLDHGDLCASTSSDRTVKIWDAKKAIAGHSRARSPIAILEGHTSYVSHCSFSPFGDFLSSSAGDNTVRLWDMKTMKQIGVYDEAHGPVMQSNWSADGTMMLSVSHDGWLRLWRPGDGVTIKALQGPHHGHLWACAFSEDQKYFATGGHDGKVVIWDLDLLLTRNKELMVLEGHLGPVFSVFFSPDGNMVVSCSSDKSARIWETHHDLDHYSLHHAQINLERQKEEIKHKIEMKELLEKSRSGWSNTGGARSAWERQGHPTTIHCLSFSPDGKDLVSGGADAEIIIWSVHNQSVRKKLIGHTASVFVISFSPDGSYLASGDSSGEILIWEPRVGRRLFTFTSHTDRVWSLHFNPKSTRLVSSSSDCTMNLWRLDDPYDAIGKSTGLVIYEDDDEEKPLVPPLELRTESKGSSSKKILETRNGGLAMMPGKKSKYDKTDQLKFKAYDEKKSALLQTITLQRIAYCCKFSKSGLELATASADSLVHLFKFVDPDMEQIEEYSVMPKLGMDSPDKHRSYVKHVIWDKDSKRLVTCGVDGTVKLWSARNGMLLRSFIGHEKEVWNVTFAPDEKTILSCSLDGTARMWHTGTGDELFQVVHADTIHQGCFQPDGRRFATCSHDGVFKVWEKDDTKVNKRALRGWPRVRELLPKIARFRNVPCALSLDGRICCYAIKKSNHSEIAQTVTVGHTVHGVELYRFRLLVPVDLAAISADGNIVAFAYGMVMRVFLRGELSCEVRKAHRAAIVELRFSEDDGFLVTGGDDTVSKVWRIDEDGQLILVKRLRGHVSSVKTACFSPNGSVLASGGADLCVKLWSTSSWKNLCTFKAHDNFVTVVAFDAPGLKLLSAGDDQTVRVWHLPKKPSTRTPPVEILRIQDLQSSVVAADFSEDGSRVVGLLVGKQIFVWHATNGTALVWWQFIPFDTLTYGEALWRTGQLALNDHLNAAIVTDSAGNTVTFALLAITSSAD